MRHQHFGAYLVVKHSPLGDFVTIAVREEIAPIVWSLKIRPHDVDFLNGGNFFTWWLIKNFTREKLTHLWLR